MNEYQQNYLGQQLSPQGFLGGMFGAPLGGLIGKGIGGLFGSPGMGANIGQLAGGIGGAMLPFGMDPMQAAYAQQQAQQYPQQQLIPQGFFGNLLGQVGQPLGSAIGGAFGNPGMGGTIGGIASQLGRMLPFGMDPMQAAYAQQQAQQLPQQQQLMPQGFFGNLLGQVGQPLGSAIGGAFGNPGMGGTIGGIASQLGRMLPFGMDPMQAAYAQQQAQQYPQQQLMPQGFINTILSGIASQLGRLFPFGMDPMQAQQLTQQIAQHMAQQQQLAPQSWFGPMLSGGGIGNTGIMGNLSRYMQPGAEAFGQQAGGFPGSQAYQGGQVPTIH